MEGKKINFVKAFGLKEFTELAVSRIETTGNYKKQAQKLPVQRDENEFYCARAEI